MGAPLIGRRFSLNAGGLLIANLEGGDDAAPVVRVSFKIVRSLSKDPNTAEITIYNLNKDSRAALQKKHLITTISAGYVDNVSQIFSGDLQYGKSVQTDVDWVTTIQSGDGSKKMAQSRINLALQGPASVESVMRAAGEATGLNLGNLLEKAKAGSLNGALQEWTNGKVLSGKAEQVFDKVVKSMGYGWSVQDGQIQILGPKEVVEGTATRLAVVDGVSTGLIGSPEPGEDGIVKARGLIQPGLAPGRKVQIQSLEVDGFYRIEKCVYSGDSDGGDWYADIEAKPL